MTWLMFTLAASALIFILPTQVSTAYLSALPLCFIHIFTAKHNLKDNASYIHRCDPFRFNKCCTKSKPSFSTSSVGIVDTHIYSCDILLLWNSPGAKLVKCFIPSPITISKKHLQTKFFCHDTTVLRTFSWTDIAGGQQRLGINK